MIHKYGVFIVLMMGSLGFFVSSNALITSGYFHHGDGVCRGLVGGDLVLYMDQPSLSTEAPVYDNKGDIIGHTIHLATTCAHQSLLEDVKKRMRALTGTISWSIQENNGIVSCTVLYGNEPVVLVCYPFVSIKKQAGVVIRLYRISHDSGRLTQRTMKAIMIDCGHGGADAGAHSKDGILEKDITSQIGHLVADYLVKAGYMVYITRGHDNTVSLDARTRLTYQSNIMCGVSIHANFSTNTAAQGIETFVLEPGLARVVKHASHRYHRYGNYIETAQKNMDIDHLALGSAVHAVLIKTLKNHGHMVSDRGLKHAVSHLLVGARVPFALVEVGFLSHEQECKKLANKSYQRLIATAIAQGVVQFAARQRS